MRLPRRALLGGLFGLAVAACLSPTLPLPPPAPPDVTEVGEGRYRLDGSIPSSGTVLVLNRRTSLVYGKVVDLVYSLEVEAEPLDEMVIWYESAQDTSDVTYFEIPEPTEGPAPDAGAPPPADAGAG